MNGRWFWFVVNFLAFPLNPHLIQRMFLAEKDSQLVGVVKLLLFSPFVAMGPGVIAGVAVAAHWNKWGPPLGCASAFATWGAVLQDGDSAFLYGLVSLLSCAALAAVMSSADSVMLGVSNSVTVDIYRNMINPDTDARTPVRIGMVISVVMALVSFWFCMEISGPTFLNWLSVQNGILFQVAPAMFLGLFTKVKAGPIFASQVVGLITAVPLIAIMLFGATWDMKSLQGILTGYFAAPSLAAALNFLTVFLLNRGASDEESTPESTPYNETLEKRYNDKEGLSLETIQKFMEGSDEPNKLWLTLAGAVLPLTVPWFFTSPLGSNPDVGIMPFWAFFVLLMTMLDTVFLFLAASSWKPADLTQSEVALVDQTI